MSSNYFSEVENNISVNDEAVQDDEESFGEEELIQLVSFFLLNDIEYGIDILTVHEILTMRDITRLPNVPSFIKGVINLRGNVIPVVDVRERFNFPKGDITDLTRIIVVETNGKLVGLIVDNVHQVVRLPLNNIDSPTGFFQGVSDEFLSGVGRLKDRLIIILNLNNILFPESKLILDME